VRIPRFTIPVWYNERDGKRVWASKREERRIMPIEITRDGARLRHAKPDDWAAVAALLEAAGLPLAGARDHLGDFIVAERADAALLGCVAVERYPAAEGAARVSGLLRSLAVTPEARGLGLGARLVRRALATAREADLADVTLLTTTAVDYFPRFGFHPIAREEAPLPVRDSLEFREACPDTATVMTLAL
jgi:N-acetylglutamate synthase-like GNAT family acetyltransferase